MRATILALAGLLLLACEEPAVVSGGGPGKVERKPPSQVEEKKPDIPPPVDFQETEFIESDRSRDPFRSFAAYFVNEARGQVKSQREVILDQYSVDELKLVGIVTRVEPARAMLVDPTGVGHVVHRGQFIGRPTVVQPASGVGAAYEVNWRIDRIREGDVVLVRDDPANPDVPSATRVIPLRTDDTSVATTGGEPGKPGEPNLENQVQELKRRLESMESRKTTIEVVRPPAGPGAPSESPNAPRVVTSPGSK
jgi:type IV pilus assembly protein PilP